MYKMLDGNYAAVEAMKRWMLILVSTPPKICT